MGYLQRSAIQNPRNPKLLKLLIEITYSSYLKFLSTVEYAFKYFLLSYRFFSFKNTLKESL